MPPLEGIPPPFNVVCLRTGDKYDDRYVVRMRNMVARNLTVPHRFICFTDKPVPDVTCMRPESPFPGWWGKLMFFRPDLPIEGPMLYIDLDMVIVANIDDLVTYPAEFATIAQWKNLKKRYSGKLIIQKYNTSVMLFNSPGCRPRMWAESDPELRERFRGDQDLLAYFYADEATFPPQWFEAYENVSKQDGPAPKTKITIHNVHDNHKVENVPWVKKHWV